MDASDARARISPTAYYTGYVWYRNGLASDPFYSRRGHILFSSMQPLIRTASLFKGGLVPETYLRQRHGLIDHLLREAVENRGVETVIEIACGLSPRGYRFKREFGERITYIEADLPGMAANKRKVLAKTGLGARGPKVVNVDVMAESGPLRLEEAIGPLQGAGTVAIITEGLVPYYPREAVLEMWKRFASLVGSSGLYLTDLHLQSTTPTDSFTRFWRWTIRRFTRGETYMSFVDPADAEGSLAGAGFAHVRVHDPCDYVDSAEVPDSGGRTPIRVLEGDIGLGGAERNTAGCPG